MINPHFANLPRVTSPVSATVNQNQRNPGINALADFGGIGQPGQPQGGQLPTTTPQGFAPRLTSGTAYGANLGAQGGQAATPAWAGGMNLQSMIRPARVEMPRFNVGQPAYMQPQPQPVAGTGMVQQQAQQAQQAPTQQPEPVLNPGNFLAPQPGSAALAPAPQPTGLLPPTGLEQQPLTIPQPEPVFNFGPAVITDDMFQQPDQNQYSAPDLGMPSMTVEPPPLDFYDSNEYRSVFTGEPMMGTMDMYDSPYFGMQGSGSIGRAQDSAYEQFLARTGQQAGYGIPAPQQQYQSTDDWFNSLSPDEQAQLFGF